MTPIAKLKPLRDVLRMHQHWKNMRTRQSIYIAQIYRAERRVLVIRFEDGKQPDPKRENYEYVSFRDLQKRYTLMGHYPNDQRQVSNPI